MTSSGYTPIFRGGYPTTAQDRWQTIRTFLNAWCDVDIAFKIAPEHRLDRSPSIQCWEQLSEFSREHGIPELRDCPAWTPLSFFLKSPDTPKATVILQQGEGDVFWAVPDEQIREDDPPVDVYQIYDESADALIGRVASVSQFALTHLSLYNPFAAKTVEWFSVDANKTEMERAYDWFDSVLEFPSDENWTPIIAILESQDIVGLRNGDRLEVSVFCEPADLAMPRFMQKAMKEHVQLRKRYAAR